MITIAKVTASIPMRFPTTAVVNGPIATMKMMNGMGLMMLTRMLRMLNTGPLASRLPLRVT